MKVTRHWMQRRVVPQSVRLSNRTTLNRQNRSLSRARGSPRSSGKKRLADGLQPYRLWRCPCKEKARTLLYVRAEGFRRTRFQDLPVMLARRRTFLCSSSGSHIPISIMNRRTAWSDTPDRKLICRSSESTDATRSDRNPKCCAASFTTSRCSSTLRRRRPRHRCFFFGFDTFVSP